jgi:MFS superfamily sulfate permease-like transporter
LLLLPLLVGGDEHRAIALAGMLAVIVALIEIGMGLARLGFVADLLSNEVQVGYMNGLALVIIVGQLPKLCGFSTDAEGFGPELKAFFLHLDSTVWAALAIDRDGPPPRPPHEGAGRGLLSAALRGLARPMP